MSETWIYKDNLIMEGEEAIAELIIYPKSETGNFCRTISIITDQKRRKLIGELIASAPELWATCLETENTMYKLLDLLRSKGVPLPDDVKENANGTISKLQKTLIKLRISGI